MFYELVILACLADRPNSDATCRVLYSPIGTEEYCQEQMAHARASLSEEGYRVFAVCAPTQVKEARR